MSWTREYITIESTITIIKAKHHYKYWLTVNKGIIYSLVND